MYVCALSGGEGLLSQVRTSKGESTDKSEVYKTDRTRGPVIHNLPRTSQGLGAVEDSGIEDSLGAVTNFALDSVAPVSGLDSSWQGT